MNLFLLGTILFLVILLGSVSNKVNREYLSNINEFNRGSSEQLSGCQSGCNKPRRITDKCGQFGRDEYGNCFRTCPYECDQGNPYTSCVYDSECIGCGSVNFRTNCDGSINPVFGDDSILDNNKTNNLLRRIDPPNPLQNYNSTTPKPEGSKDYNEPPTNTNKEGSTVIPTLSETQASNLVNNLNMIPYIPPENAKMTNCGKIQPECCGDIHYHYYYSNPNPSGSILDEISRSGGILSNKIQNGVQQAENAMNQIRSSSNYNSAYNFGIPGTQFPTDSKGAVQQFRVKYETRPSVTGMFNVTGPLGANIGNYGSGIKGCNCPPCSALGGSGKTEQNIGTW